MIDVDEDLLEYCLDEINEAAEGDRVYLYTPSVLQAAAEALHGIQGTLEEHGIAEAFTRPIGSLASRVLSAYCERFARENYYVSGDVDPVALLTTTAEFIPDHLDAPLVPAAGPAMADSRATVAYLVLPRRPESPAWGENGDAPLVVAFGRTDLAAEALIYSSGGGPVGRYRPGPWGWYLSHEVPGHYFIGNNTRVIAQAPSNETAGEVAGVIAKVLTGQVALPR
jgi:hypothetical protein